MQESSKDPDYALRLEHAIAKKYGKETIINPASLWSVEKEKKYLKELRIFYSEVSSNQLSEEHSGCLISKKLLNKGSNKTCIVCGKYKPLYRDRLYFIKYNCCYSCYIDDTNKGR